MQSARSNYWDVLRRELAWPFRCRDIVRERPPPRQRRDRLEQIAHQKDVPFHLFCIANDVPACVRDALALLVIAALRPELRPAGNPRIPSSPALPRTALAQWAASTAEERDAMCPWFALGGLLEQHGLIVGDDDEVVATSSLLQLVADQSWPAQTIDGVTPLESSIDAHVGVTDDFQLSKLSAVLGSLGPRAPIVHIVGPRGSGRLRIASALASRRSTPSLLVIDATKITDPRIVEAALCEARVRGAQVIITNCDDVSAASFAPLVALARTKQTSIWTTSAKCRRWCASALVWTAPAPNVELRRDAWRFEVERRAISVEDETIERLAALHIERNAITMAATAAAQIYRGSVPYEALADITNLFSEGFSNGMRS